MLRTTLSTIKRVCSLAFIPRILQGDVKNAAQKKFTKDSLITPRATKTTSSSNSGAIENSDQQHKKQPEENKTDDQNVQKCVEQNLEEERERCNHIISKIFPPGDPLEATLNTNTASNKEELTQKLEHLSESALVEAPPKLNDHGRPRVLGQQESITANEYYYPEPSNYDNKYDDLANRCLTTPPNEVDEHILKELGVQEQPTNEINFSPKRPTESYYSQVIYGQAQVIRFNKANEAKSNQCDAQNDELKTNMGTIYKAELIQPLIFDSVSLCECLEKGCDESSFDALEDAHLSPVILNPYTNQAFPFYDYAINEDMTIETPIEEETMTVTTAVESDIGNNAVMPPAEMEIESEPRDVKEDLKGTIEDLGVSGETSATEPEHISNITETSDDGYVYTKSTTGPPVDWLGKNYRQQEKNVKASTSISSKDKKEKQSNPANTAISENQNPNDIAKMKRAEKYINEKPDVTEYPEVNNLVYATKAKIRESDMEMDTEQAPVYERQSPDCHSQEAEKVAVLDTKVKVSHLQEALNTPIFEQKTPISNEQADEKVPIFDRKAPHFEPETAETWNREPQNVMNTIKPRVNCNISSTTGPVPDLVTEGDVTLKELLRRIRERHRQELCRDYFKQVTQIEMADSCTKSKTLGPNPCKPPDKEKPSQCPPPPKCPPSTQKDPCAPKKDPCAPKNNPCAPKKKDPCAKFSSHLGKKIHDTVSLLRLYFLTDFGTAVSVNYQPNRQYCCHVLSTNTARFNSLNMKKLTVLEPNQEDIILARDYEPWTPIPSWPIPKKEKQRPFVCPKEGCKLIPPPPFNPQFKDKPCVSFPKKTFSLVELFDQPAVIRSQDTFFDF